MPASNYDLDAGDSNERARLLTALQEGAGLTEAQVRRVMRVLDAPPYSRHDLLGSAQAALVPPLSTTGEHRELRAALSGIGWRIQPDSKVLPHLAEALVQAQAAGVPVSLNRVVDYAVAMQAIAEIDLSALMQEGTGDPACDTRLVVLGSVMTEPVLKWLRMLAQAQVSAALLTELAGSPDPEA